MAITPVTRSPTRSGAAISALTVVCSVTRRGSRSTSLTISPTPVCAIVPMMPWPRRKPWSTGISSPKPATEVSTPLSSSSSMITPSVATIICRACCRVRLATRSTSSSAASFSEKL